MAYLDTSNYGMQDKQIGRMILAGLLAFVLIFVMFWLSGMKFFDANPPPKRPPENKPAKLNGNAGD